MPPRPKEKGTVLDRLRIRKAEQAALKKARPGATPPTGHKPAPPPRALSPAELLLKPTPQVPPQVQPPPAQPVPPPPGQEEEGSVLEILFARAMRNRTDAKPADDPGMAMLQAITHQVQTGKPIKDIENVMVGHLGEMTSKIHLYRNAMAYHTMFERSALLSLARWTLEKSLWEDLINQRLTPVEKLALLNLSIKENDKIQDTLGSFQEQLENDGKGNTADIETATEKVDRPLKKVEDPTIKDLVGTSPVGRELARRLLSKAGKASEHIVADALKKPA
ncbi:MAG: hypothetical protein ACOYB3_00050 [Azonexus sp.]